RGMGSAARPDPHRVVAGGVPFSRARRAQPGARHRQSGPHPPHCLLAPTHTAVDARRPARSRRRRAGALMWTATAAVLREYGTPLRTEKVVVPELREDEVLVRIRGVGICH